MPKRLVGVGCLIVTVTAAYVWAPSPTSTPTIVQAAGTDQNPIDLEHRSRVRASREAEPLPDTPVTPPPTAPPSSTPRALAILSTRVERTRPITPPVITNQHPPSSASTSTSELRARTTTTTVQHVTTDEPTTAIDAVVEEEGPRAVGRRLAAAAGWVGEQWSCLERLWTRESGWSTTAGNRSGAYGIPQALPGSKMASAGSDWRTSATTQVRWGLQYLAERWGSPCAADGHQRRTGWY